MTMSADQTLRDLATHTLTIRRDDGLYRHLFFKAAKDSWNMWFEIITWPNCLIINGDMGSWSFSRVEDMFQFFRCSELRINASYWHEKVTAESRFGGPSKQFAPDTFKSRVLSTLDGYGLDKCERDRIAEALDDEVFGQENGPCAYRALAEFKGEDGFQFSDPWELDGEGYSYHFLWCLYAIVWSIQQYDAVHKPIEAEKVT